MEQGDVIINELINYFDYWMVTNGKKELSLEQAYKLIQGSREISRH